MQMARNGPGGGGGKRSKKANSSSPSAACGNCATRRTPNSRKALQDSRVTPTPIVAARAVLRKAGSRVDSQRTPSRTASKQRSRGGNSDTKQGGADSAAPTGPQTNGIPSRRKPHQIG